MLHNFINSSKRNLSILGIFMLLLLVSSCSSNEEMPDERLVEKELYRQIKFGDVILLAMRMPYHFGGTYYEYPSSDFVFIRKDGYYFRIISYR